jgi:hypothetical protein
MNLHTMAAPLIRMVNANRNAALRVSTGYTTGADGTRVPSYARAVGVSVQVQNVGSQDLKLLDGMKLQQQVSTFYLSGEWEGVIRGDRQGGDLIDLDGETWLIVQVVESWPGWCKLLVCLQITH